MAGCFASLALVSCPRSGRGVGEAALLGGHLRQQGVAGLRLEHELLSGHGAGLDLSLNNLSEDQRKNDRGRVCCGAVWAVVLRLNLDGLLERIWQASVSALMLHQDSKTCGVIGHLHADAEVLVHGHARSWTCAESTPRRRHRRAKSSLPRG